MSDNCETFLNAKGPIFDVRSPGEYAHGKIPGALTLPLFTDAERAVIGTLYKQEGRLQAIECGLKIVGPKLFDFVTQARSYAPEGVARVHCWRGGMRSSSMAWLLQLAGIDTKVLTGGYKAFRKWVLKKIEQPQRLIVLGGLTGSGKTSILAELKALGEQVLDFEAIASHRGSSYGMLKMPPQPSSEQFENEIAVQWHAFDARRPVWVEDESRLIGTCKIPDILFAQMQLAPLIVINRPLEERLDILTHDYGELDKGALIAATQRLVRRLGSLRTKEVIQLIERGEMREAIKNVLQYYDATYQYGLSRRATYAQYLEGENLTFAEWALKVKNQIDS